MKPNTQDQNAQQPAHTPWTAMNTKPTKHGEMWTPISTGEYSFDVIYPRMVSKEEAEEKSAFIVRACNAHQELVDALQMLYDNAMERKGFAQSTTAIKVRAALKKATSQP